MENNAAYAGGIVRILTAVLGGYFTQKGLASQEEVEGIVGAGILVATGIWSIWAKKKALAKVPKATVKCILIFALMLGASGCVTRTRCQALEFKECTFNVNEPTGIDDPKYPRSLQIGVNDLQAEGGSDSIASGNKTDPRLTIPTGDSALGAVAGIISKKITGSVENVVPSCSD